MMQNGKWIWARGSSAGGTGTCTFRYVFECDKRPKSANLMVAATNRCFVWMNGNYVMFAGGRASTDQETYYDTVDVADSLKKGANVLVLRVKGGAQENGVVAECPEIGLASSDRFLAYESNVTTDDGTVYTYNATTEHRLGGIHAPEFISDLFGSSEVIGDAEAVLPRPVPSAIYDESKKRSYKKIAGGIVMETQPGAAYPRFTVTANSGEHIVITGSLSDRKLEYVTCAGEQTFEFDEPLFGTLNFEIPASVKLGDAGYRLVTNGAEEVGSFTCDREDLNELYRLAHNTFETTGVHMFTDTVGGDTLSVLDASVAVRNALYLYAEGTAYAETTLSAVLDAVEGNDSFIDVGNRAHTLLAFGTLGLAADCFRAVNNADLKQRYLTVAAEYLQTIDLNEIAMLCKGDIDGGYNSDSELAAKSLYFSAVQLCKTVADELGIDRYNDFLSTQSETLGKVADNVLRGNGLSLDKNFHDDRANALAILSGLAPQFMAGDAARVMATSLCCTPLLEGYVTEALLGARSDWACNRMAARLATIKNIGGNTIPEDYASEGAGARAAASGYIGAFFKAFAGVELSEGGRHVTITPELNAIDSLSFTVPAGSGKIVGRFSRNKSGGADCFVDNQSDALVALRLKGNKGFATDEPIKVLELKKGKNAFRF